MDSTILIVLVIGGIVLILLMVLFSAIRVVQQYERGVIFVLGRLIGAKGPGSSRFTHPIHPHPRLFGRLLYSGNAS